ncbi:MAG TPA: nuclear transport factor 2 family protein [Sphingomonas sp.]|nr:nuclear transport factor 2 family protein [Sphingomonas sp.]
MSAASDAALSALLDKQALHELAMRYSRAIDRRDPELLATVYHPDAHDEHGAFFDGPASTFIANLKKTMAVFEVSQHMIGNASYRLDGDYAEGELYFTAYHRTLPPEPRHEIVRGRYLDRYERRDGEWRIAYRRLVWDSYETTPVQPADTETLRALGEGGKGEDDYSYRALTLLGRGR